MKKIIYFLIILNIITAISCKKESKSPIPLPNTESIITSFSVPDQVTCNINSDNKTITITMPIFSTVNNLIATFVLSEAAKAKVDTVTQVSGTTANDFTNPVTYYVTSEDGKTTIPWVVTVNVLKYTIESTDFPDVGELFRLAVDSTNLSSFTLGDAGENKTWNFSTLGTDRIDTVEFLNPATQPGGSFFPGSTFGLKTAAIMNFKPVMFGKLSDDKAEITGFYINNTIHSDLSDNLILMKFPSYFGVNYTDDGVVSGSFDTTIVIPITINFDLTINVTSTIDGSGTVITPSGSFQCIREYRVEKQNYSIPIFSISNKTTTRTYNYINKDKGYHVLEVQVDSVNNITAIKYLIQ